MDNVLSDRAWEALMDDGAASIAQHFGRGPATWACDVLRDSDPALLRDTAVFISLKLDGHLRGCIGTIFARDPLWLAVRQMAKAAAFEDPRFPPLSFEESGLCSLELSILSPLQECRDWREIEPGTHGVLIRLVGHQAVFLPQVASEQSWDRETLLSQLSLKAFLPQDAWKDENASLSVFTALHRRRDPPIWQDD